MTKLSRTQTTFAPPVMEARRWLDGVTFPPDRPLINVSQAAPIDPPPAPLVAAMAEALQDPATHLYGPVLGLPDLRAELAAHWSAHYGAEVRPENVAITAGCNQAFAASISAICGEGDEVLLPTPWYFNHKMWLDMDGVTTVPLPTDEHLIPQTETASSLITERTRAIVLVSPNNPGGAEYPAETLRAFMKLAKAHDLKLIVDETYKDFDSRSGAPHDLLTDPEDRAHLIQLYSFSKAYRLTGHRVGAVIASEDLLPEIEKFLDTVTICTPQLGQRAALWGLRNLGQWVARERDEILDRRAAIADNMPKLEAKGWKLLGLGAYFAYFEHPFEGSSADLAPKLVREASVLTLPGTMFMPASDPRGARQFRFAFANVNRAEIGTLFDRLAALDWPQANKAERPLASKGLAQ
ncbi:aminotransferase [Salipiger sp. PrR002]|uniref:aminotransferase n=1 Tax=Salipiger sp. PrR002 TaxID=2706489 RepID=UPI0013B77D7B|nr:aminotransferase [Salipiger sp. PrR002]NDV99200.1 aminotransferase [Salipiger sp. PrR002]NDW55686.1 aminotransferase [Salipiger sp. PrR004]